MQGFPGMPPMGPRGPPPLGAGMPPMVPVGALAPGPGGGPPPHMPPMPGQQDQSLDWQRTMMLYRNPDLAVDITQQQALEYDQAKASSMNVEPEVTELSHHYSLSERHTRMLDEQLKKRNNTYEEDIASMYEILKGAKNPADLLMVCIRWMAEGTFRGVKTPNSDVERAAKKYKLDAPSACKLAEVLESRGDPDDDLRKISKHLERSNKPSALVMKMLKDLKNGNVISDPTHAPALGSYAHLQEQRKQRSRSRERKGRSRSPPPRRKNSRKRSRSRRGRSRSRSGRRARSRSRGR